MKLEINIKTVLKASVLFAWFTTIPQLFYAVWGKYPITAFYKDYWGVIHYQFDSLFWVYSAIVTAIFASILTSIFYFEYENYSEETNEENLIEEEKKDV